MKDKPDVKFPPVVNDIESWLDAVKRAYDDIRIEARHILHRGDEDDD